MKTIRKYKRGKNGADIIEVKNPKLVEVIEAQDMVEYYEKKLKAAKIHLKKLKQE